jgi:serine/threonine protein kinase
MQDAPKLPGFELLKPLGGGPMTQVLLARDCAEDRLCVVKLLRPDWDDQPTAIKLLQREARAGLTVRHPHLVEVLYAHVTRAPYFLVLELLPGESLRQRLQREYRLKVATALWIARQTAEALACLHRAGFIHGDLKPDNIQLVDNGTAKLLDLGFAHRPGENAHFVDQGYVLGTVNYLAPELCAFDPKADQSADIFSLGVMLFEMLSGRLPYPPGSSEQTMRRHRTDPPSDIRRSVPCLPASLVTLLDRLLANRSGARPRAAGIVQQLIALEIATLSQRQSA